MIENHGKITVETVDSANDPQITLKITAPASEWRRVRDDLGEGPERDSKGILHTSYDFYRALDRVVDTL